MRKESEPTLRVHLLLYESDVEWLHAIFGRNIGVSPAVRQMVRDYRRRIEAKEAQLNESIPAK